MPPCKPSEPTDAVLAGVDKLGQVGSPALAFYALPKKISPRATAAERAYSVADDAISSRSADAFAAGNPRAKAVRIANADHDVFNSNPKDVAREMNAFMDRLAR
jgi:hypothetical protein